MAIGTLFLFGSFSKHKPQPPNAMTKPPMISFNRTSMHSVFRLAVITMIATATVLTFFAVTISAQKRHPVKHGIICGDPTVTCKTNATFQPNDLPFRVPKTANIYDTDLFYAIMLKSANVSDENNCETFVPENDRLAAQALFPAHKVFSSRCADPGGLFYTNTGPKTRFMAVYAGMSLADANSMLRTVKATGKYPGANIRRMRAGFNGT